MSSTVPPSLASAYEVRRMGAMATAVDQPIGSWKGIPTATPFAPSTFVLPFQRKGDVTFSKAFT